MTAGLGQCGVMVSSDLAATERPSISVVIGVDVAPMGWNYFSHFNVVNIIVVGKG